MSIRLSNIEAAYQGASPVIRNTTVSFEQGWTAVVGENGAGKSTLLAVAAGDLVPTAGERIVTPANSTILLVPQEVEYPGALIETFFDDWSKAALAWRARLRLDDEHPNRWASLSFGERKRWQLGAALARRPDMLLIDEPTNHLDGAGVDLLADALRTFAGVGVMVSHDRRLLEPLAERTVEVHAGRVRSIALGYTAARAAWQQLDQAQQQRAEDAKATARREAAAHAAKRRDATEAAKRIGARTRMKGSGDSDARSAGARARVAKAAARHAQRARAARTRAARADKSAQKVRVDRRLGRGLSFEAIDLRRRRIVSLVQETIRIGERVLAENVSLDVDASERIAILGANGTGKSTLLRRLQATCTLPAPSVFHLPQEISSAEADALIADVLARPPDERGTFLSLCAALGVPATDLLERQRLSPGEARKAQIADALGRRVAAMFLDEPTNHLDLPSIERLESALAEYSGAIVVVTHDLRFVEAIGAQPWKMPPAKRGYRTGDEPT